MANIIADGLSMAIGNFLSAKSESERVISHIDLQAALKLTSEGY